MLSIFIILINSIKGRKLWEESTKEFRIFCNKLLSCEYLRLQNNEKLNKFVFDKAMEFCENNDIPVYELPDEVLNNDVNNSMCGCFRYIKNNESKVAYDKILATYKKIYHIDRNQIYPRIEILDEHRPKNYFGVLIHEIGHWYLYINNIEQNELDADAYVEKFFKDNLPEFFQWVFQIEIHVRVKHKDKNYEREFSTYEAFIYYNQCLDFLK